ncbi:hypothetical protein [Polaromonas eurypsychrophila]|uniref:Cellulose biosynthesis protein BcsS n=1 Tax=Polaromonas eurypsychrophila TaxID=1614635 RepID=A0A916SAQ1_9BURK|nr:hypothetical protein [Polaromonas eurypsychrophila]GGA89000.1 hypothetical protein GCM10011496_07200 [Polaromonas eurypsychrophila]
MRNHSAALSLSMLLLAAGLTGQAQAGRPLTVDDAGVDDAGTGHIDAWYARQPGGIRGWTVGPTYSPAAGVGLSASLSRDSRQHTRSTALQGKFLLSPSRDGSCNLGASVGVSQTTGTAGTTSVLNGLLSCNHEGGAAHLNTGAVRNPGGPSLRTWGLALERELGRFTAHAEWFGQKQSAPVVQLGLRTEVAPGWQLDGSIGRTRLGDGRERLYSLGFVRQF